MMLRKIDGFTLVELIITIAIGSLITLAATTTLLLGLRINAQNTDTIIRQNTTNMLVQVLDRVANADTQNSSEEINVIATRDAKQISSICRANTSIKFENNSIFLNGVVFMEDVASFNIIEDKSSNKLLTVQLTTTDGNSYEASVYCRTGVIKYNEQPT